MKTQNEKSINTINLQPTHMTSRIEHILLLDIAGGGNGQIARLVGLTESRVSVIRNCPMYEDRIKAKRIELEKAVIDKQSDRVVNDPAKNKLFDLKLKAVEVYEKIIKDGKSEFAQLTAANQVCDRTDLRPQQPEKARNIIQITQKLGDRFIKAIQIKEGPNEHSNDARVAKEGTKTEVSP